MAVITLKKQSGKKCLESLNWYELTEILLNKGASGFAVIQFALFLAWV